MKITFILIIIYLIHIHGFSNEKNNIILEKNNFSNETYTKYKLRNLAIKGRNKLIKYMIDTEYENIHNTVLQEATLDKTNLTFTILCFDEHNPNNNIYKTILTDELIRKSKIYKITNDPDNYYKISNDFITSKIIDKLKITFPQSNIILNKERPQSNNVLNIRHFQCLYYTLEW